MGIIIKNCLCKRKKPKIEFENDPIFGLKNLGNTCFMNSSLQCLIHSKNLKKKIKSIHFGEINICENKKLLKEFYSILQNKDNSTIVDPSKLKKVLGEIEEKYKYNEQNDANEFITIFLNQLLVELKGFGKYETKNIPKDPLEKKAFTKLENKFFLKNKSFLLDLFYGRIKRDYICEKGHTCCVKFNNYNTLILPQPTELKNNIVDLLNSYQSEKEIDDTIACPKCEKEMKYKIKTSIYSIPDYFILFLEKEKLYSNSRLNYTQELDCISFMENNNDTYKLNSLISYSGNRLTGHYIAKCRYKDFWYCMNDSFYRKINDSEIVDRNAIILFYEKI
jgi:ubiquitin C-terminal hydrolase